MKQILMFLLVVPILALCSCNDESEQLAIVRTIDAQVTPPADSLSVQAEALIGGTVLNDGGMDISERGILFGETPNPSTKTTLGSGTGEFTTTIQFETDKAFYYRAYAVNGRGMVYGDLKMIAAELEKPMFPESFDGKVFPPLGWTVIDHDGDGFSWVVSNSSRLTVGAMSESYDNLSEDALTPYNLLITPKFEVTGSNMVFSWKAGSIANGDVAENYKIVVSTTGNTFEDFDETKPTVTKVFEETMTAEHQRTYVYREVDLSAFAGQQVYVAVIHYNCTNQYAMVIKEINLSGVSE